MKSKSKCVEVHKATPTGGGGGGGGAGGSGCLEEVS